VFCGHISALYSPLALLNHLKCRCLRIMLILAACGLRCHPDRWNMSSFWRTSVVITVITHSQSLISVELLLLLLLIRSISLVNNYRPTRPAWPRCQQPLLTKALRLIIPRRRGRCREILRARHATPRHATCSRRGACYIWTCDRPTTARRNQFAVTYNGPGVAGLPRRPRPRCPQRLGRG